MSKLKAIEVRNFMSIAEARLEFDESNIISICGYNDSGKSALTRLLEIMFYNAYSQDQVSFIKDGSDYWGCSLEFDDGVEYNRYKYADGKSEYELKKDGELLFSNRTPQGVILAMDKVPEQIENYLGVISVKDDTMNEKLNVRRNTDKLFLINTTGGENYKMLNTILRSDLLSGASKKLSQDRNALQTEASVKSTLKDTLTYELDSLKVCDKDTLNNLSDMTTNLELNNLRYEYLASLKQSLEEINNIVVPKELSLIDTGRLQDIEGLYRLSESKDIEIPPECTVIALDRLKDLNVIIDYSEKIADVVIPECGVVNLDKYNAIMDICSKFNELYEIYNNINKIGVEIDTIKNDLEILAKQYNFKICKNCGSVVE